MHWLWYFLIGVGAVVMIVGLLTLAFAAWCVYELIWPDPALFSGEREWMS